MDLRYEIVRTQIAATELKEADRRLKSAWTSADEHVDKSKLQVVDTKAMVLDILEKLDKPVRELVADQYEFNGKEFIELAREAVKEELLKVQVVEHHVIINKKTKVISGSVHECFDHLLRMVSCGINVWVAGPAGSGKTTAARQVADALGLDFYFNGAIDSEYKLSGFIDAQGRIVSTAFREAYTNGGLYLFDEVDASLPSAVLAFNAALAGDVADFPGCSKPTPRHKNLRCVAAANTWGYGGGTEYVGRSKMDAAFLDRFVQLAWPYDEVLERRLVPNFPQWVESVQQFRLRASNRGLKVVISPRATVNGALMLENGFTHQEALEATIFAKISVESRKALMGG
jgi:hypothetical protein